MPPDERELTVGRERVGDGHGFAAADRPRHFVERRGPGQPLQLERAERQERRGAAGGREVLHELGREDLAAFGARAQPRGFCRRQPAHIVLLDDDFARAHADAHLQRGRLGPALAREPGLDRGRGGDRVGRGREDRHGAVAQPLHDRALIVGDGLGEDAFVPPFDLVGAVVTQARAQRRGTDEVGDQHRDRGEPELQMRRRADAAQRVGVLGDLVARGTRTAAGTRRSTSWSSPVPARTWAPARSVGS